MQFISLDIETTGFEPEKNRIIEFGAIKFDLDGNSQTYQSLFNPGVKLPEIITHITGIDDKMLSGAPKLQDKFEEVKNFIGDLPIIGHNIQFDTGFLRKSGFDLPNDEYDTLDFASILMPTLPSYSLEILSTHLKLNHKEKHRALDDSIAAMELFLKLMDMFRSLDKDLIKTIQKLSTRSNWPLKDFLNSLSPLQAVEKVKNDPKISGTTRLSKEIEKIIQTDHSALFEAPQPHQPLMEKIANNAAVNISCDNETFLKLSQSLPEELGKMDLPERYLSAKRLEEFTKKDFFENHEITALIKYLIWKKRTNTGLLNELNLLGKERNTIYKVNADENFVNIEKEEFVQKALKHDKKKALIISHDYLIQKKPQLDNLLLFNFESFAKRTSQISGSYITMNHYLNVLNEIKNTTQKPEIVDNLINKTTILFGLIGIAFDKNCDPNTNYPRLIIDQIVIQQKEWLDCIQAFKNIVDISQELGNILNKNNKAFLSSWKKLLQDLLDILQKPDLQNYLIRLEKNYYGETIIKKTPLSVNQQINDILGNIKVFKIIDENIDLCDDGAFFKKMYELPEKLPIYRDGTQNPNLEIIILKDTPEYENAETKKILPRLITGIVKEKKGHAGIICSSRGQLNFLTPLLGKTLPDTNVISQLTGSISKTSEKFKENPANSILMMTPNGWENFTAHEQIDLLLICRIPFEAPATDYMLINSNRVENNLTDLMVPKAIISLKKIINRIKKGRVLILDSRLTTKNYGESFIKNLERMGNVQLANSKEFLL